jgi:tRNA G18 (ribose-2'-O)-methylase SpoU
MMTEVYQHIRHHPDLEALAAFAAGEGLPVLGVDNAPGAVGLWQADLPRCCIFLFGQEGPGLSPRARELAAAVIAIPQYGSTRSINAGAASAVVMAEWCRRHGGDGMISPE